MIKFLKAIWENDWTPASLLETVISTYWYEYDKPDISFFGTEYGCSYDITERTIFGKFIDKLPGIISLMMLILYYPVASILWTVLCIPMSIIKGIVDLFTKKWGKWIKNIW